MKALTTRTEVTEVPEEDVTMTKAILQKYSLGDGSEIYWHEMIQMALRLVGKLFL